ncbi:MAG: YjjI family glycine radical enzyme [Erysipelotrichaceae bacterium]
MSEFLKIVQDESLTYHQQMIAMARLAESLDDTLVYHPNFLQAKKEGIICDLNEGVTPYRPRYIVPDYRILMEKGSAFLGLDKPTDLMEACNYLLIMYQHVPSITAFPVFLGNFDELLEPFVIKEERSFAKKILKLFLLNIDRTLTDSFVHADIGPMASVTGELLLELTQEMQLAIPNLTLKYDEKITPRSFAEKAAVCMMYTAKPSFANHAMFTKEWGEDYAIASCYNGLLIQGGGYTLPRLRLYEMSKKAKDVDDFMNRVLPFYTQLILDFMDQRIRFIVEESSFFKSNFLVKEAFVTREKFTGMLGVVGTAECVNNLLGIKNGYGYDKQCDDLAEEVLAKIEALANAHHGLYCSATDHHYRLHAQVGIDSDGRENSPGARIPVGQEPVILEHIMHSGRFHKYFPTGIGDIFKLDETWIKTPGAIVDIINGAFTHQMRYFSAYNADSDVVRVTGYLVKRSELAKLDSNQQSLNNASIFGKGARDFGAALDRKIETLK